MKTNYYPVPKQKVILVQNYGLFGYTSESSALLLGKDKNSIGLWREIKIK